MINSGDCPWGFLAGYFRVIYSQEECILRKRIIFALESEPVPKFSFWTPTCVPGFEYFYDWSVEKAIVDLPIRFKGLPVYYSSSPYYIGPEQ